MPRQPDDSGAPVTGRAPPNRGTGRQRGWLLACTTFLAGLAGIIVAAYLGWIAPWFWAVPHLDTAGHFLLYGCAALLLDRALGGRAIRLPVPTGTDWRLPAAVVWLGIPAALEEAAQSLSPNRTLDLADLAANLAGMLLFCRIGAFVAAERARYPSARAHVRSWVAHWLVFTGRLARPALLPLRYWRCQAWHGCRRVQPNHSGKRLG